MRTRQHSYTMVLNGLGFSNRQLYLVPHYFANKPVEYLLGSGMHAEMLNDDCLGRTLDWLYDYDLTKLFAGIVIRARRIFGVKAEQMHVDRKLLAAGSDAWQQSDDGRMHWFSHQMGLRLGVERW